MRNLTHVDFLCDTQYLPRLYLPDARYYINEISGVSEVWESDSKNEFKEITLRSALKIKKVTSGAQNKRIQQPGALTTTPCYSGASGSGKLTARPKLSKFTETFAHRQSTISGFHVHFYRTALVC